MKKTFWLVFLSMAAMAGVAVALAAGECGNSADEPEDDGEVLGEEEFRSVKSIEGFASLVATRNVEAESISDAESAGAGGAEKLAWGQAMLEDLERMRETADAGNLARAEDVFAFRDWCIGAAGRGNLLLAIAAEETAAALLFRALAEDPARGDEVRRRFARCLPNGLPADYWLETLALEGTVVDCGDALKASGSEPEYHRMCTVLETLDSMLGGWDNPSLVPKPDGTWNGCTDVFAPAQLTFRTMAVARKEIALEVCLAMLEGGGEIPDEKAAFIGAADKYAAEILCNRNRFTATITPHEVWRHWTAACATVAARRNGNTEPTADEKDLTDLREVYGAWTTDGEDAGTLAE